jgi:hypothetical protein
MRKAAFLLLLFIFAGAYTFADTACKQHSDCAKDEYCQLMSFKPVCHRKNFDPGYAIIYVGKGRGERSGKHTTCDVYVIFTFDKNLKSESFVRMTQYDGKRVLSEKRTAISPEYDIKEIHSQFLEASESDWVGINNPQPTVPRHYVLAGDGDHYIQLLDDSVARWENKSKAAQFLIQLNDRHCP